MGLCRYAGNAGRMSRVLLQLWRCVGYWKYGKAIHLVLLVFTK
jgi:hypothetical protein